MPDRVFPRDWPTIVPAILALAVLYPLVRLALATVTDPRGAFGLSLAAYTQAFSSPIAIRAVEGTLLVTGMSIVIAVPLASVFAWITARTDAPLAAILSPLPIITLALPPLVGAIGWYVMLAPRAGLVNLLVRAAIGSSASSGPFNANTPSVLILVVALSVIPYAYGVLYGAFRQLDAGLQEAAAVCGLSPIQTLTTVVLPVIRPALVAAALLAGMVAASEVSYPLVLTPGTGITVIPVVIYQQVIMMGTVPPARAMSVLLSFLTVVGMVLYTRATARGSFVTVGGRGLRVPRTQLGPWRYAAAALVLLYLICALVLPLLTVVYLSLVNLWTPAIFREPLALLQYKMVLADPQNLLGLLNSGWLSVVSATLVVVLGFLVAFRRVRRGGPLSSLISWITTLPLGIPAVALGFAVLGAFSGSPFPLYGTPLIMIVGYVIHQLPLGVRNSEAALVQISRELEDAAAVSGVSVVRTFLTITVPLMRGPLLAAWAFAFIVLFRDLAVSIFLYTPETTVSAVNLLTIYENASIPATCAYAAIMTAVCIGVVFVMLAFTRRRGAGMRALL